MIWKQVVKFKLAEAEGTAKMCSIISNLQTVKTNDCKVEVNHGGKSRVYS